MQRTIGTLRHYWDQVARHLPQLHPAVATIPTHLHLPPSMAPFTIVGIRLGFRLYGLQATYSIAPTVACPRLGMQFNKDLIEVTLPLTVQHDVLFWHYSSEVTLIASSYGHLRVTGHPGPLHRQAPCFSIQSP